ncbi:MAG: enzyme repeat protein, partial [Phycisphaerales bacterium]|nr:enzyme repeat protein [Phycisphaerales bacterium]
MTGDWLSSLRSSPFRRAGSKRGARRSSAALAAAARAVFEPVETRLHFDVVPHAQIAVSDVTAAGGADVRVTVTYAGDRDISVNTVGRSDIVVTRRATGEDLPLTFVSVAPTSDASPVVGTYLFAAPGGTWDAADNGGYDVVLGPTKVFDVAFTPVDPASATFNVNVTGDGSDDGGDGGDDAPRDKKVPKVALTAPPDLREGTGGAAAFEVRYTDDRAIDVSTIGTDDLTVAGPDGQSLTISAVATDVRDDGKTVVATYTALPPGGAWDVADNGTWLVVVLPRSVTDTAGKPIDTDSDRFAVAIDPVVAVPPPVSPPTSPPVSPPPVSPPVSPPPTSPPTSPPPTSPPASPPVSPPVSPPPVSPPPPVVVNEPPRVTISQPDDVTEAGGSTHVVSVTYADADGVDANTIGADDLTVTGPVGPVAVTGVTLSGTATARTATYTLAAPGSAWDAADAGTYAVVVSAGAVADVAGVASAQAESSFDVTIAAAEPTVDPAFSGGAAVSSGFVAEAAVALDDGKLVLAGRQGSLAAGTSRAVLKRLNADGSVDATFGQNGTVISPLGVNRSYFALAVLPDGSLVAAGRQDGDLIVAKHKATGALDNKFGGGGVATADLGGDDDAAYGVAVAADGSVVAGGTSNGSFAFARFTPAGALDTFFGDRGMALFAFGTGRNAIGAVAVGADGKIVGVGSAGAGATVVRLNADGSADAAFGTDGAVAVAGVAARDDLGDADRTLGAALLPSGKLLVANGAGGDFAVARLNADGSIDRAFGTGGTATVDFGGDDDADAVVVQGSGEILVVGTTTAGATAAAGG